MAELVTALRMARTLLFVPGDRPDRFAKAAASGADLVVLDLEDSVGPAMKEQARTYVAEWLDTGVVAAVRVNASGTPWHDDDVAMVSSRVCIVMLPKAEDAARVSTVAAQLPESSALVALVETARGVLSALAIAQIPKVGRLTFGSYDLAAELGVSPEHREAMAPARAALVLASAAAGLPSPIDGISGDIADQTALRKDVEHARGVGFRGKLCIHPRQVSPAAEALAPSRAELLQAQAVVEAAEGWAGGVVVVDGRMVDKPVFDRANRLLGRHDPGDRAADYSGEDK